MKILKNSKVLLSCYTCESYQVYCSVIRLPRIQFPIGKLQKDVSRDRNANTFVHLFVFKSDNKNEDEIKDVFCVCF